MRTKHLQILSCLTVSLLALQSYAQDQGFYFKIDAGPSWNEKTEVNEFVGVTGLGKIEFDTGARFDAAIGYQFNPWLGAEFETGIIYNEIKHFGDSSLSGVPLMVNLVLTVPIPDSKLVPFVGGGIGGVASVLDIDHLSVEDANGNFFHVEGSDTDMVFAWQGFAGLKFLLNDRFDINLAYRYLATQSPSWDVSPEWSFHGPVETIEFDHIQNHSVVLSATWRF